MSSVSLVFSLDIIFTPGELIQMDGHVAHARALATKEEADAHLMATQAPMLMAAPASRNALDKEPAGIPRWPWAAFKPYALFSHMSGAGS